MPPPAHRASDGAQPLGRVPARLPARLPARGRVPGGRRDGRGHLQRGRPALGACDTFAGTRPGCRCCSSARARRPAVGLLGGRRLRRRLADQFSPTARLAFMVVGPMVDLKLIAMQAGTFGRAFAVRFSPATVVVAVLCSADRMGAAVKRPAPGCFCSCSAAAGLLRASLLTDTTCATSRRACSRSLIASGALLLVLGLIGAVATRRRTGRSGGRTNPASSDGHDHEHGHDHSPRPASPGFCSCPR